MARSKAETNAAYYERHKDRIILRESELQPSTILELIRCLQEQGLHHADNRVHRLQVLYRDLTGAE